MLVVAAVSLMLCLLLFSSVVFSFCQQVSKQIVCFFCLFVFFLFFCKKKKKKKKKNHASDTPSVKR